jgi:peptide methionine sulfoxide reductase msrA/msrB
MKTGTDLKIIILIFLILHLSGCTQNQPGLQNKTVMKFHKLTPEEEQVIIQKGTERPFTGKYENFRESGTYTCKRCRAKLFRSGDKFDAHCGWPSFDDAMPGAVKQLPDPDGIRTEIECARCGAHLGHLFMGERFTPKDTRYCVNSVSMEFEPEAGSQDAKTDTAVFAGGCFWGVEYYMKKIQGVISCKVGYTGGHRENPTYKEVCNGNTGYLEATEVVFDPSKTNFEEVSRMFFEIHDPTQWNHQGPDYGEQYRSAVFYKNEEQKQITEKLIGLLKARGYKVVTEVRKAEKFWKAEDYHQDYYKKNGHQPYCHGFVKRF